RTPPFHGGNRGSSPLGDATITRSAGFLRVIQLLNGPFVCLAFGQFFSLPRFSSDQRSCLSLAKYYYGNNIQPMNIGGNDER
ncbi:hypothetical protein Q1J68_30070, partial [Pseudomonas pergaminensis]|uniref:hypothetical protein n=1 Tax=Pseudomonas pergaminensis TaxID=2853159 RepID=UPI0034D775E4